MTPEEIIEQLSQDGREADAWEVYRGLSAYLPTLPLVLEFRTDTMLRHETVAGKYVGACYRIACAGDVWTWWVLHRKSRLSDDRICGGRYDGGSDVAERDYLAVIRAAGYRLVPDEEQG